MTDSSSPAPRNTLRIRQLNDEARRSLQGVVMTSGIAALSPDIVAQILKAVVTYDDWHPERNDPYGHHDFGSLEVSGYHVFWKCDVFDNDFRFGSPDPADPEKSRRVITILLAEEY